MTRQDQQSAHPHDPDADRLSAAWNDIVEGFPPSTDSADAELIATVRSLHASVPDHRPQSEFRNNLREQLMETAVPITTPGFARVGQARDSFIGMRPARGARSRIPQVVRGGAVRWVAIAATIALLVTTAFGAWRGGIIPSNQEPNGTNVAAPFLRATPANVVDRCQVPSTARPYGANPLIAQGLIVGASFSEEVLAVTNVQMQGWKLAAGEEVQFADQGRETKGVGVDVVVNGAYAATFSTEVTVSRPIPGGGGGQFEYPGAHELVELSRGDAVTYQIGTRIDVQNKFQSQALEFQSILFYAGDPPVENRAATSRFESHVDGDSTLAEPLDHYASPDITVLITFLRQGCAVPQDTDTLHRVLGPVPTTIYTGEAPGLGFIVWLSAGPQG
jgi:hypothetical protein